jgi:hypothetical protein
MTRALTRTHFHSSRLICTLADLSLLETVAPGAAFAEKLGLWVSFTDAISLSVVHSASFTEHPSKAKPLVGVAGVAAGVALGQAFAAVRAGLVRSINRVGAELSAPEVDAPTDLATVYAPYRRYYLAQQREIELKLYPLRLQVRAVLARASAEIRKLAALDAAMEQILCERESKLLLKVPALLEKRFRQLHADHQQALAATQQADNPALWLQPGGWLAGFCRDMQTVLIAELDLRLQPALGLMEALQQDLTIRKLNINE